MYDGIATKKKPEPCAKCCAFNETLATVQIEKPTTHFHTHTHTQTPITQTHSRKTHKMQKLKRFESSWFYANDLSFVANL